jgi:hypothetical protein
MTKLDSLRHPLPQRRTHTVFRAAHVHVSGRPEGLTVGIGQYGGGQLGEVFIDPDDTEKTPLMRDVAILISLLLQHGASIETIRNSITRREDGTTPGSIIGSAIDAVADEGRGGE